MTKRTFIAIDIFPGERLNRTIQAIKNQLSMESIRWTSLSPAHITLSFLGDTTELQVTRLRRIPRSFITTGIQWVPTREILSYPDRGETGRSL